MSKKFWCSFEVLGSNLTHFEYHGPWWVSWHTELPAGLGLTICAAVIAENEEGAKRILGDAFDPGYSHEGWRFLDEKPSDWSPYSDRFPRAEWMGLEWVPK